MIKITNLHKNFGKLTVLHDLDLTIKEGGIFAVLGPNGSGKTTLIKSILGMVIPKKGEIIFDNEWNEYNYRTIFKRINDLVKFEKGYFDLSHSRL